MDIDRATTKDGMWSPRAVVKLLSGEDAAGVFDEEAKQSELDWAKPNLARSACHTVCRPVKHDVAELESFSNPSGGERDLNLGGFF